MRFRKHKAEYALDADQAYTNICLGMAPETLDKLLPKGLPKDAADATKIFKNYMEFVIYFVRNGVKRRIFDKHKCTKKLSTFVSIADEAYILVSIYNNWNKWNDMMTNNTWDSSTTPSLYTQIVDNTGKLKNVEWTKDGIDKYNQYVQAVKTYRQSPEYKCFEKNFKAKCIQQRTRKGKAATKQNEEPAEPLTTAYREQLTFDTDENDVVVDDQASAVMSEVTHSTAV